MNHKTLVLVLLAVCSQGTRANLLAQEPLIPAYPEPKVSWVKPENKEIRNYESEDVLVNKEMIAPALQPGKWTLFKEKGDKWSGDQTLRGNLITEDRSPTDPEAAVLHFRIPVEKGSQYTVLASGSRSFGVSLDGKDFKRANGKNSPVVEGYIPGEDAIDIYVANCFAFASNPGSPYIDTFTVVKSPARPVVPFVPKPRFDGFAKSPLVEKFNRGVAAIPMKEGGIYVSWRLLHEDPPNISFDVFRTRDGKESKLNSLPLEQTCDYPDPDGRRGDRYAVRPAGGVQALAGEASPDAWKMDEQGNPYLSIKLHDPKATVQKVGIADLNGDGVYDFVVKTPNTNVDPWDRVWKPSTQTYKLEGYLADGTFLWTKDLGWNIECGMWYSPFIVWDFDGDGKAEVAVKTADGGDYRDKDGRVYSGPETLSILDGMTGKEKANAPWPNRDGFENYNEVNRNQLTVAYLDGKTPCVIPLRGTYGTMKAEAWQLHNGKLESAWKYQNVEGYYAETNKENSGTVRTDASPKYYGQGAHQSIVADLTGDGRDDVILGSVALNGDGDVLWSLAKGHNDWMILTDIIWEHPGMEIAYMYETPQSQEGTCVVDAKTGKLIWGMPAANKHLHRGHAANFDPTLSGPEILGIDHIGHMPIDFAHWRFTNTGRLLSRVKEVSGTEHNGVYWDADLEKETVGGRYINDYNGGHVGEIKGTLVAVADLFGDWREEVITSLPGELRIYSTAIPAMDRRECLMQNHPYRMKVAINSQGYYYDPNLTYMPTFESNNFSLIFHPDAKEGRACQVTVSASKHGPLAGMVSLTPPAGVSLDQTSWNVELKPGEIAVRNVRITGACPNEGSYIRGELKESGTSRIDRGRVPIYGLIPQKSQLSERAIRVPVAGFTESGGTASIVKGRPVAVDGCLIGWDNAGHQLTWKAAVPRAGKYRLLLRYATNVDAQRRLSVNGENLGTFSIVGSGGFGREADEWDLYAFKRDNEAIILNLNAGDNALLLENTDGNPMNLAYLYLEPAE